MEKRRKLNWRLFVLSFSKTTNQWNHLRLCSGALVCGVGLLLLLWLMQSLIVMSGNSSIGCLQHVQSRTLATQRRHRRRWRELERWQCRRWYRTHLLVVMVTMVCRWRGAMCLLSIGWKTSLSRHRRRRHCTARTHDRTATHWNTVTLHCISLCRPPLQSRYS